jgi:NAD(P)H dehydrogenase (quinone)
MLISQNQAWGRHRSEVSDEPTASLADLEWADGIAFGTPTRFGNVAAQLKLFLDQAGQLWQEGKLVNKVATAFTSSQTDHGGRSRRSSRSPTPSKHWGAIVVPLGYTAREVFIGGGNPYGASFTSRTRVGPPDPETVAVALAKGRRLARVAQVIGLPQEQGRLDARAGSCRLRTLAASAFGELLTERCDPGTRRSAGPSTRHGQPAEDATPRPTAVYHPGDESASRPSLARRGLTWRSSVAVWSGLPQTSVGGSRRERRLTSNATRRDSRRE